MRASKHIVALIAEFEGGEGRDGKFHPYQDSGGTWTIGYGHIEGVGPFSAIITKSEAQALLLHDLNHAYVPALRAQLKKYRFTPNQNEFDALVDMVYNCGPGILSPIHTIGQRLKAHDRAGAASSILLYDHDRTGRRREGLTRRRKADKMLFLKPVKEHA